MTTLSATVPEILLVTTKIKMVHVTWPRLYEASHFKFRILIDIEEAESMRDISLPKGMCSESRDLFKFLGISNGVR